MDLFSEGEVGNERLGSGFDGEGGVAEWVRAVVGWGAGELGVGGVWLVRKCGVESEEEEGEKEGMFRH